MNVQMKLKGITKVCSGFRMVKMPYPCAPNVKKSLKAPRLFRAHLLAMLKKTATFAP